MEYIEKQTVLILILYNFFISPKKDTNYNLHSALIITILKWSLKKN